MSPASSGALEVERYIGACLISSQQSRHKKHYVHHKDVIYPPGYVDSRYHVQRCNSGDQWAGGVPLISFSNSQRCWNKQQHDASQSLSRLAVHTQGVPLILSNNKYRKNKNRNNGTKVDIKKQHVCTDTVSVASDESSGSTNSDNCLPRVIKPRKRRKRDRKPPHLQRPNNQDGSFSTDSASPDIDLVNTLPVITFPSYTLEQIYKQPFTDNNNDTTEAPKLHHSFEDVEESADINGNVESLCQCRYCDPSGQIWDIDRSCYSPFLTSPPFQFPESPKRHSYPISISDTQNQFLIDSLSTISLEDDKSIINVSSSSHSSCDLEVSTEIVTSLNGHRDIEIKFFSSNSSDKSEANECIVTKCPTYASEG